MYIKEKDLESRKKKYIGTINLTIKELSSRIEAHLKEGFNRIVVTRGQSFHQPGMAMWLVNDKASNLDQLEVIYKQMVTEEVVLYGMSRKSDKFDNIINNFMKKQSNL